MAVEFRAESDVGEAGNQRRSRCAGALRAVRRQVRARNPDAGPRRTGSGLRRGSPRSQVPGRRSTGSARDYVGRPTPLYFAPNLTELGGGARIFLKREDLAHTGAHKINNALGQALLAKRMGKQRIIAETGAGQHGVATATVCALLGLECIVYMGEVDIARQSPNVFRMKLLGAEVRPVSSGSNTLKDAINEAIRDWVDQRRDHLLHHRLRRRHAPLPDDRPRLPVRHRPRGARPDARADRRACRTPSSPASAAAPTRSASSTPSSSDREVELIGVEAAGHGIDSGSHAASLCAGSRRRPARLPLLRPPGRVRPGAGSALHLGRSRLPRRRPRARLPEGDRPRPLRRHHRRRGAARVSRLLCRTEGIIPALESSHAIAYALPLARRRARTRPSSSTSPAAATRTCKPPPTPWG